MYMYVCMYVCIASTISDSGGFICFTSGKRVAAQNSIFLIK